MTEKLILSALIVALTGCATSARHSTPGELLASPSYSATVTTPLRFNDAFQKLRDRMRACHERAGTLSIRVIEERTEARGELAISVASILSYRILSVAVLTPSPEGTIVNLHYAVNREHWPLPGYVKRWLNEGHKGCPDDAPEQAQYRSTSASAPL